MHVVAPPPRPWYREPWPWFLACAPLAAVVAGSVTLWLAIASQDGLVADDYYRQGLAINRELSRVERARTLGLSAELSWDAGERRVSVRLAGGAEPPYLWLELAHPSKARLDQKVELARREGGVYAGTLADSPPTRWRLRLSDPGRSWQLTGTWQQAGAGGASLQP